VSILYSNILTISGQDFCQNFLILFFNYLIIQLQTIRNIDNKTTKHLI